MLSTLKRRAARLALAAYAPVAVITYAAADLLGDPFDQPAVRSQLAALTGDDEPGRVAA